ncbi:hypothetical protein JCM10213_003053 [Rhodosporidiobolus nylandii]
MLPTTASLPRSQPAHARGRSHSPTIRKPSIHSFSHPSTFPASHRSSRRSRKTLTPPLPPGTLTPLCLMLVLLVLWCEWGVFRFSASGILGIGGCKWNDAPSVLGQVWDGSDRAEGRGWGYLPDARWAQARRAGRREGQPFHVLVAADPQLLDMRSYPGRSWILRKLGVWISDLYARKGWRAVMRSRGTGGTGVDAVVWLGDLMDGGVEAVDAKEHSSYIHRFHTIFPLPRASISSFSPLSLTSSWSSSLVPPIPSIVLPGNHDLGLHLPSASLASYHRERFADVFGPTWGEREWNGWRIVWVDSMALLEHEFWEGSGGTFASMKGWLEGLKGADPTTPTILLTHIPLFRPEGTFCGSERESSRPIRQGAGRNYQNELGARETKWLVERVGPTVVYSGDDHDACTIRHPFASPLDGVTPVIEVTVKAFSLAMGVSKPGYHLLSLYAPLPTPSANDDEEPSPPSYTYTQTSCLLPSQFAIYLRVYLPLFILCVLAFFLPKSAVALRTSFHSLRRRSQRRKHASALANGTAAPAPSAHGRKPSLTGRRQSVEQEITDEEAGAMSYPGLFGGVAHLDSASPGGRTLFDASDSLNSDDDDLLPTSSRAGSVPGTPRAGGGGRPGHVRRVSRVWLWEGGARPRSPSSSTSTASAVAAEYLPAPLVSLLDAAAARLASNSLLAPFAKVFIRPIFRLVRAVWRKVGAPFVLLAAAAQGVVGWAGLPGQVLGETCEAVWEVAGPAVWTWLAVSVWWSL